MFSRERLTNGVQNGGSRETRNGPSDDNWPEVKFINDYAVFMGYLSMAVTGTGILVLTWSTVVLLGGFVTLLTEEDFWSLTVITLVQTRVFDVFLNGIIRNIGYSFTRLQEAALPGALRRKDKYRLCSMRGLLRLLVFSVLLCPLFALYTFGLFVSPWISLWRLYRTIVGPLHGNMPGEKANLKPALLVLYSLALLQGALFYYWAISALEEKSLVKRVAQEYGMDEEEDKARQSVSDYLRVVRAGSEKDLSFARGRNLVTYAVELMESNSPGNYLSGARILDSLIRKLSPQEKEEDTSEVEQLMLMKDMIGSASSSETIKKLVRMLDSKDRRHGGISEMRKRAMGIVEYFAKDIRLDKITQGITHISSLLELEDNEPSAESEIGLKIVSVLAKDRQNYMVISTTDGIAGKIIRVIANYGSLHTNNHDKWMSIVLPGLQLIKRLVSSSTAKNAGKHVIDIRRQDNWISSWKDMVDCQICKGNIRMQKSIILALTGIMSTMTKDFSLKHTEGQDEQDEKIKKQNEDNREFDQLRSRFIKSLVVIFVHSNKNSIKKLAGESLAKLSNTSEAVARDIIRADVGVAPCLTKIILEGKFKHVKSAAHILLNLCKNYKRGDKGFDILKDAMIRDIPKVLTKLLVKDGPDLPYIPYSRRYNCNEEERVLQQTWAFLCKTAYEQVIKPDNELKDEANTICKDLEMENPADFQELVNKAIMEATRTELQKDSASSSSDDDDDYSDDTKDDSD